MYIEPSFLFCSSTQAREHSDGMCHGTVCKSAEYLFNLVRALYVSVLNGYHKHGAATI